MNACADQRHASVSVEVALLLPIMLVMLFFTIELVNGFRAQAKLQSAGSGLAEMVAARNSVTAPAGSLADLCTGAGDDLLPYPSSSLAAQIVSISVDHPCNRVPGSTDCVSVAAYLDWENDSACPMAAAGPLGLDAAFRLANTPVSQLTQSGAPASGTTDKALRNGATAIVVAVHYAYANVLPFGLGAMLQDDATDVIRPRSNTTVTCTDPAGTAPCPPTQ